MIFGVPKELRTKAQDERRVGLTPLGVAELKRRGAEIYVESGAGEFSGFSDGDYKLVGGRIVYNHEECLGRADVLVKVQGPKLEELDMVKPESSVLGFLHLSIAPDNIIERYMNKNLTAIATELIRKEDGTLPVVKMMSAIAGKMAVQIAGRLLENHPHRPGRGVLLGSVPGLPPADVVIVGAGALGTHAAMGFLGLGARVILVDRDPLALERAYNLFNGKVVTMLYSHNTLEKLVKFADVLILCVLIPGERAPILVTREMVSSMKPGSVIMDFSIDQGGACETSRPTPTEDQIYCLNGVIHFAVPNVPSWVARTSSIALTNTLMPYLNMIQELGMEKALRTSGELQSGLVVYKGKIVNKQVARNIFPYFEIHEVLEGDQR